MADTADDVLRAGQVIEYPFNRTVGPVQSAFLTGLREGIVVGVKRPDGSVMVPPVEYDPDTAEELTELVQLPDTGVVGAWTWLDEPRPANPLDSGFAWALITIDGADTGLLHAVDCGSPEAISAGTRVKARWRDERIGQITDIVCFDLEEGDA